jgi:hypothetical protein
MLDDPAIAVLLDLDVKPHVALLCSVKRSQLLFWYAQYGKECGVMQ